MKYVYIDNSRIVTEVIPDYVPEFPDIPVTKRYSKEFLSHCLEVNDSVNVESGMEYLPLQNVFTEPIKYTGTSVVETELGKTVNIPVSFSVDGTWKVTDSDGLELNVTENNISATPAENHSIIISFTDSEYSREFEQTIRIFVAENPEPTPEPEPEDPTSTEPTIREQLADLQNQILTMRLGGY